MCTAYSFAHLALPAILTRVFYSIKNWPKAIQFCWNNEKSDFFKKKKKYLCKFEFQFNGQFIHKKPTNLLLDKGDTNISFGQFLNKKCVQPITRN